ncbi:hypothetical protein N7460_010924 [Penicillium canescens]|uniref:SMODS and SLOG-associating 2TM effector domain-containing protein n=1 Tax=Penicillium canescens TaxID=5083 RepID=A0AAD6N4T8_PENCN|nr:hypothetical protein N7460_010924 [Penicillium canescens]KAJ6059626.1 hypothetical protein N7444_003265 [Penicillium canescens]
MPDSLQLQQDHHDLPQGYLTFEAATSELRRKLGHKVKHQKAQYHLVGFAFNLLAVAQVMIGAAITALGPTGGEHMLAITILGAFNTSIAGILALLKGRGFPHRLRRNMVELENGVLLRYGESEVLHDGDALIREVFQRYITAQQIIESNQPDTYAGGTTLRSSVDPESVGFSSQTAATTDLHGKGRQLDEEMGSNRDNL